MSVAETETIRADIGLGDWQAPQGTEEWAKAVRLRMLSVVKSLPLYPNSMRELVESMREHQGWKVLRRADGKIFRTFEEFCAHPQPHGLGKPWREIKPFVQAALGGNAAVVAAVTTRAEAAPTLSDAGKLGGRPKKDCVPREDKAADNTKRLRYGTDPEYLAARIARDAPQVLEDMKAGKFKSVRAAAKAAGIVKDPDVVTVAARAVAAVPTHRLAELVCRLSVDVRKLLLACIKDAGVQP